jgi:hypothetical protein
LTQVIVGSLIRSPERIVLVYGEVGMLLGRLGIGKSPALRLDSHGR